LGAGAEAADPGQGRFWPGEGGPMVFRGDLLQAFVLGRNKQVDFDVGLHLTRSDIRSSQLYAAKRI